MKGFLSRNEIEFEEHDVFEDEQARAYVAEIGAPGLPVVVVDGQWRSVFHPNQLGDLVPAGRAAPPAAAIEQLMDGITVVLSELEETVARAPSRHLATPTGVQGMDFHGLVLFAVDPLRSLPEALATHRFMWRTDRAFRSQRLESPRELADLFAEVRADWTERCEHASAGDLATATMTTARGSLTAQELLESQLNRAQVILGYLRTSAAAAGTARGEDSPAEP